MQSSARATVLASIAAALLVVAAGVAALYQNPIYLIILGVPSLVVLGALAVLARRPRGEGPQS